MNDQNVPKFVGLFHALDGLLSLTVLGVAGYFVDYYYTAVEKGGALGKWWLAALIFLGMALSQCIRIYLARTRHRLDGIRHTVYMVVFLVCAGLILLSRQSAIGASLDLQAYTRDIHFRIVTWLYEVSLILSRVLTILRDRTPRSTYINLALIAVIVILMWQMAGRLTGKAAEELGLMEGIPVFGGGGDTTFVNIGAGCTRPGDTHIYVGTSGWVSTFLDYQTVDIDAMITGVLSAKKGYFNYYAELETAGKCFEWVMEHLALDEIGVYLEHTRVTDHESRYRSLYDYLSEEISKVPPGANGVIFTPWLHGNRCPFEDSQAGGIFFNIRIENGKRDMIRAVLEGICYHLRWLLESEMRKVETSDPIRFVGGGALSPVTCQMLSDITGRKIETVNNTQEVGAMGTALVVAAGIKGMDVLELSRQLVKANRVYVPDPANREVYERNYRVFKGLYKANAKGFQALNA